MSILTATALAAAAGAQNPFTTGSTVTYTLGFVEIGGNSNGTLEPGESALIQISVAFSNQYHTASFAPPVYGNTAGTIRGLGLCYLDLDGTANNGGNARGTWDVDQSHGYGPNVKLDPFGPSGWGTPANGGSQLHDIGFGNYPFQLSSVLPANPINAIWQGLWTPESYEPRTVTFAMNPAGSSGGIASGVILRIINLVPIPVDIRCASELDALSIALVPVPASTLLLTFAFAARRRRDGSETP